MRMEVLPGNLEEQSDELIALTPVLGGESVGTIWTSRRAVWRASRSHPCTRRCRDYGTWPSRPTSFSLSPLYLEVRVEGLPGHLEEQSDELIALTPVLGGESGGTTWPSRRAVWRASSSHPCTRRWECRDYLDISKSSLTSFSLSPLY